MSKCKLGLPLFYLVSKIIFRYLLYCFTKTFRSYWLRQVTYIISISKNSIVEILTPVLNKYSCSSFFSCSLGFYIINYYYNLCNDTGLVKFFYDWEVSGRSNFDLTIRESFIFVTLTHAACISFLLDFKMNVLFLLTWHVPIGKRNYTLIKRYLLLGLNLKGIHLVFKYCIRLVWKMDTF